jgi:phosphocarrier protein HPr
MSLITSSNSVWPITAVAPVGVPEEKIMKVIENLTVLHRLGIHLRSGAELAGVANRFKSTITVSNGSRTVNGKSLLDLLTIGAIYGTVLEFSVEGEDSSSAIEAIRELVRSWQLEHGTPLKLN